MIKIAINATYQAGGGQIPQLINFIRYFASQTDQFLLLIYITQHNYYMLDDCKTNNNTKVVMSKIVNKSTIIRIFWEQFILPFKLLIDKVDILFCPGNISPIITRVKKIQWIGTIGPFWDEMYRLEIPIEKIKFKFNKIFMYKTAQHADAVIFESDYTRNLFINNYDLDYDKSYVIKAGRDINFFMKIDSRVINKYNIKENFILCVSHLYPYKNIINLLKAYSTVRKKIDIDTNLVIAGSSYSDDYTNFLINTIDKLGIKQHVNLIGNVKRENLRTLYSACYFLAFPSPCENFAYTLAEAMCCGTPIVSSNTTAMPETCEDAALYFNPYDLKDISNKLLLISNDKKLRNDLRQKALQRANKLYDYEQVSMETINIMKSTLSFS